MVQTVPRKRIEILVDTPLVPRIVSKLKAVDISGWSVIHVDSGDIHSDKDPNVIWTY